MNHQDTKTPRRKPEPVSSAIDEVARQVVDAAYTVHHELGPGLLESIYEACLARELELRGIPVERQASIPVVYKGVRLPSSLRIDLLVGGCVVVEVKAVDALVGVHTAQILTYLKLSGLRVGFLVNFNVGVIKDGIRRIAL